MQLDDVDRIVIRSDPGTGLKAIFVVHDLTLGPAMGGVRRWVYDDHGHAIADAVNLARGMTCKNALAGLPFGGGKSVILARPGEPVTDAELLQFGRWVDELGGEYVTAEDVGMRVADLERIATVTRHVTGIGRNGLGGDPGPKTAYGVFTGIRVIAQRLGQPSLATVKVGVQGLGSVGMRLCELLRHAGAELVVCDIDPVKVACAQRRFAATPVSVDDFPAAHVDIVAPCALGASITPALVAKMHAKAVAGSANNQLASPEVGAMLQDRGILYAPDFVINAGGIISAALEYLGQNGIEEKILEIGPRLNKIFEMSQATGKPTSVIADEMAMDVLGRAAASSGRWSARWARDTDQNHRIHSLGQRE